MKPWIWLIVAVVGWGMMLGGFASQTPLDSTAPWSSGLIVIGPVGTKEKDKEKGKEKRDEKPAEKTTATPKEKEKASEQPVEKTSAAPKTATAETPAQEGTFAGAIPVRLRLLAANDAAEMLMFGMQELAAEKAVGTKAAVRTKLIEVPLEAGGLDTNVLQSGRLPKPGQDEVIAGARVEPRGELLVGGRKLKVVGVLKPDVALFADAYILPPDGSTNQLFPEAVPSVLPAHLVRIPAGGIRDEKTQKDFARAFPSEKYVRFAPPGRLEPRPFYLYLAGLALLLLGGSGALIGLYRWLAERPGMTTKDGPRFLAAPIVEMRQRSRLLWAVHLLYFGLVIVGSVLIYELPEVQAILLEKIREALGAKSGPLAAAGKAYLSGNIARAAVVTFVINFFLGSLVCITLPSVLFFGAGIFVSWLRAILWGLLLAPTIPALAYSMLPHSGTMLLEGEGYILAAFFGCLIPIHTVSSRLGGNPLSRWGRVLLLNFTASFWIALVLAVAAIYEATEVIWMNR